MKSTASCLIRFGAYRFGQIVLSHSGRTSPYLVKDPIPRPSDYLANLALASLSLEHFSTDSLCLLGIANSGLPLTHAINKALCINGKRSRVVEIYPKTGIIKGALPQINERLVLIDNAVTTGATFIQVSALLSNYGIKATKAIRIFDRKDINSDGMTTVEISSKKWGIALTSIFSIRDLLPILPDHERKGIIDYLCQYGSNDILSHLSLERSLD